MQLVLDIVALVTPVGTAPIAIALLLAISFLASLFTATFGLGGGVVMVVALTYFIPIVAVVPVHGLIQLGSNSGRAFLQRSAIRWDIVAPFAIGALVGSFAASFVVVQMPENLLLAALAVFILVTLWVKLPSLARSGNLAYLAGGAVSTFLTFFVGATGPLIAALLRQTVSSRFERVASQGFLMALQHLVKTIVFAIIGFQFGPWLGFSIAMIGAGFAGTIFGTRLLGKISARNFERGLKLILTLLALDMLRRALGF